MNKSIKQSIRNIFHLGVKEIRSLMRDPMMLVLILYSFSLGIIVTANGSSDTITKAAIAVVDDDQSMLSQRITDSFLPPMFLKPKLITQQEIDKGMDRGDYTFVVVFPPQFEKDVLAGNCPSVQLNVDATRMSQAFSGAGYIQKIINQELARAIPESKGKSGSKLAEVVIRNRFNPNLTKSYFDAIVQLINNITMLAIILTGAALIRERESGTLEHLLVLPVTAFDIMVSKIWSMGLVVLVASFASVVLIIEWFLKIPIAGSILLFTAGMALYLFAVTSLGIFLACKSQNMPQLGLLFILVFLPMNMLSGGSTPLESMPEILQTIMQVSPTTQFVSFSQAILFRGAGIDVVWKEFLALFIIGSILFGYSLIHFRKSVT
ncbi:MAG: ABC transporter permease [Lentisphaeria bacterium]|nr:ABC transporter permease [Lentisphaeria bacterium]